MTPGQSSRGRRIAAILAAGKGTRMLSESPKILHQVGGRPLLAWVIEAARQAGCEKILVIVGHGADQVREQFKDAHDLLWVEQRQQLGTGHAVAQTEPHVTAEDTLLVLSGDVPLVRPQTLERLAAAAGSQGGALAVAHLACPGSLGRVLSTRDGRLQRIVEAADASAEELAIDTVNAGIYALPAGPIFEQLHRLQPSNAQGELYLTDAVGSLAASCAAGVELVELEDSNEAFGVNNRRDLAIAHRALIERHLNRLMARGVTILEPTRTVVEPGVEVAADTILHAGVTLTGSTRVGRGCILEQGVWARNSEIGDGVRIEPYSVLDGARVGKAASVGPFARLRPATVLGEGSKVGNFVELKKTTLGAGSKTSHLTYLGDATVGAGANIGAGVVTCNYDGKNKHRTEIGAGAFVGSDTMLVAPVEVGAGATTAAGSTITQNVPPGALGVGRARQRNIEDWASRKRRDQRRD